MSKFSADSCCETFPYVDGLVDCQLIKENRTKTTKDSYEET